MSLSEGDAYQSLVSLFDLNTVNLLVLTSCSGYSKHKIGVRNLVMINKNGEK